MAVVVDPNVYVPPDHLRMLESHMASRPGNWRVFSARPDTMTYTLLEIEQENENKAYLLKCTVQLDTQPLFDLNHEDEVESNGKRFGDGQVVARLPEHLLYAPELKEIGRAFDEGDLKYARKVLNDPDFKRLRSFRGDL